MPETIYELEIPYPETQNPHLKMGVGACRLNARPARKSDLMLEGTYTHPTGDVMPRIIQDGSTMILEQGNLASAAGLRGFMKQVPVFDLHLGKSRPYMMTISAGAYEGKFDLGGLPLTGLKLEQGAGSVRFDFSSANPEMMEKLWVEAGAASIKMDNLLNASFREMKMNTGAASTVLDFGGLLTHEAVVKIDGGMASLRIIVPAETPAQFEYKNTLGSVKFDDGWAKQGSVYLTDAALEGRHPLLIFQVSMSL
ncbi:MAG: hypothetical protein K8I82_31545, partial [Anaerolineae bacterium]|nr:hypothetical protein [Anaerolineae bacterium]